VCSNTTLVKMTCQISTSFTTGMPTGFISTKLLSFLIPMHNTCMNAHRGQFEHFLKLSSFDSVSDIILLQLSEFPVNRLNDWLYCISCMLCYKVEELRSRFGAKLQHVLLTFPSGVFLQKCQNWA